MGDKSHIRRKLRAGLCSMIGAVSYLNGIKQSISLALIC
jgi:hypothetical protein